MAASTNTLTAMEKAKGRMLFKHLFFATIILSTPFIESDRFPTAATNMKVVYWNPTFIASLSNELVMFVIAHEVFHIILKHGLRRGSRHHVIWNVACDFYINAKLKEYGFTIWKECCYDPKYDGMYEEQIYQALLTECQSNRKPGNGEGEDGEQHPGCPVDGLGKDLEDVPMDPTERAQIERVIDSSIARAMTVAKQAGKLPAGLELLLEGVINPPQPWFALFVDFMTKFTNTEDSWSRRNSRFHNFILPSKRNPGMGGVGVIGDTSGSMLSYEIYPQIGEEITQMMITAKPEFVQVIWADASEASYEERFEPGEEVILHPMGGGGTDMRLPLKKMEDYEVEVCILVTDTETPWPSEPTPFPLIILTTTNGETPNWATTIRIR